MAGNVGDILLEVRGLRCGRTVRDVSLCVRRGEVLGLAGLQDAGTSDLLRSLFGMARPSCGEIRIDGRRVQFAYPWQAVYAGITWLPRGELPALAQFTANGALTGGRGATTPSQWLARLPDIVLIEEPTADLDDDAKAGVHRFVSMLARQGRAVLVASSDVPELLSVSDRIVVLHTGRVAGVRNRRDATRESIEQLASGTALISGAATIPAQPRWRRLRPRLFAGSATSRAQSAPR